MGRTKNMPASEFLRALPRTVRALHLDDLPEIVRVDLRRRGVRMPARTRTLEQVRRPPPPASRRRDSFVVVGCVVLVAILFWLVGEGAAEVLRRFSSHKH